MRRLSPLGLLLAAACHHAATSGPKPVPCSPAVPRTAMHPIAMRPAELAGDYELVQVQTQPNDGAVTIWRLHLAPLDSATKVGVVGGAVRDLVGRLELLKSDSARRSEPATDRGGPGAVLAGENMRIGHIQLPDGWTDNLKITAVSKDGFWGWWQAARGLAVMTDPGSGRVLPDAAGYFCALRMER